MYCLLFLLLWLVLLLLLLLILWLLLMFLGVVNCPIYCLSINCWDNKLLLPFGYLINVHISLRFNILWCCVLLLVRYWYFNCYCFIGCCFCINIDLLSLFMLLILLFMFIFCSLDYINAHLLILNDLLNPFKSSTIVTDERLYANLYRLLLFLLIELLIFMLLLLVITSRCVNILHCYKFSLC